MRIIYETRGKSPNANRSMFRQAVYSQPPRPPKQNLAEASRREGGLIKKSFMKKKILYICGSLNQTTMMHKISMHLPDYDHYFSAYYADGIINYVVQKGFLNFSILNGSFRANTDEYIRRNNLNMDYRGVKNDYDLVYTCADLIYPKNIRNKKVILVQEGMTNPETIAFHLVKWLHLPRWMADTSAMGISNLYDIFCVASEGYKKHFVHKGADENKIIVTGIPNFDNFKEYLNNGFPHKNFVLVATSDIRETLGYENRKKFIQKCLKLASGRKLIFRIHPHENFVRAVKEINTYAPEAIIFTDGNTEHMVANCDVLITQYSSLVYVGLGLGKEVHSYFKTDELKRLLPIQNDGTSAERIARIGKYVLESPTFSIKEIQDKFRLAAAS